MSLSALLSSLRRDHEFMANVMAWRTLPAQPAQLAPLPPQLHPALVERLQQRGINQLYSHQAQTVEAAQNGQNVVVTTPTASGKTLCYNLPVFDTLLRDPAARAIYLFPTKALAHDQLDEIRDWRLEITQSPNLQPPISNLLVSAYDGDTPSADRPRIRKNARIVLTNPDMLHTGMLPYHTQWAEFLSGLRYVVIDEMHTYRGIFGSHVANVLRRLQRLCAFYGSQPRFIFTSATIANPGPLAERLIEQPVTVITENGAPRGEKHVIIYNPPLLDAETGARRSVLLETDNLAARSIRSGVQTIVFGRSRRTVELLLTYLREHFAQEKIGRWGDGEIGEQVHPSSPPSYFPTSIRGYRGGYLPEQRRVIEAGLRSGEVRGVVATNALELGIDIGALQAAILCGYPGSIASIWQQMGRAGRTQEGALAILVTSGLPIDQYLARHPEFIFDRSPEQALINPDNLMLLVDQLRCAAFELPFAHGESFGHSHFSGEVLDLLLEQGDVKRYGARLLWSGTGYPARQISLRSAGNDPVVIQVGGQRNAEGGVRSADSTGDAQVTMLGEVDRESALREVHDGAIYLHEGESYRVDRLDLEQRIASVTPVNVDFYTTTEGEVEVEVLQVHAQRGQGSRGEREQGGKGDEDYFSLSPFPPFPLSYSATVTHGDLRVISQITGYRRIRRQTHEVIDSFPLDYPPSILETAGYWFSVSEGAQRVLAEQGAWFDSINNYGPNWQEQRQKVRSRDSFRCTQCGSKESPERAHDVHHVRPFRTFGYVAGVNDNYKQANLLGNLLLVCRTCHRRLEAGVRTRGALDGLGYAINNIAPIYLMCDRGDIGVYVERAEGHNTEMRNAEGGGRNLIPTSSDDAIPQSAIGNPHSNLPTIYIYERIAAGLGFSLRLYELHEELLAAARELISSCPCHNGCPACVGPVVDHPLAQLETKRITIALLDVLLTGKLTESLNLSDDVRF